LGKYFTIKNQHMKYTEYTFEHFDSASGAHKVQKWIDGPSVDFLDYTVNKNKNYQLSYYDAKSLVFNFIRNQERDRVLDIISNSFSLNPADFWDALLDYNINSNQKATIMELSKFLLDKGHYPNLKQTVSLLMLNCDELNKLLTESKGDFKFSELNFDEYLRVLNSLSKEQLDTLELLGFKRNSEWDITMKTLKEHTPSLTYRRSKSLFWDDPFFMPRTSLLSLL
jgi:hypothetical protein